MGILQFYNSIPHLPNLKTSSFFFFFFGFWTSCFVLCILVCGRKGMSYLCWWTIPVGGHLPSMRGSPGSLLAALFAVRVTLLLWWFTGWWLIEWWCLTRVFSTLSFTILKILAGLWSLTNGWKRVKGEDLKQYILGI